MRKHSAQSQLCEHFAQLFTLDSSVCHTPSTALSTPFWELLEAREGLDAKL